MSTCILPRARSARNTPRFSDLTVHQQEKALDVLEWFARILVTVDAAQRQQPGVLSTIFALAENQVERGAALPVAPILYLPERSSFSPN